MDSNSKKPNKAGELQPYIPEGNGDKKGEYTFSYFCVREGCTKEDLKRLLTEEEIRAVRSYTDFRVGCAINKRIREEAMIDDDVLFVGKIKSAVNKYELKNDLIVYRGISVPKNMCLAKFLSNYESKTSIHGSLICSTSKNIHRAISAGRAGPTCINLIFLF